MKNRIEYYRMGVRAFRHLFCFFAVLSVFVSASWSQKFPYTINSWKEEGFKERFLGSYGVASDVQPELNVESYNLAEGVFSLMDTPEAAILYIGQGIDTILTKMEEPSSGIYFLRGNLYYEIGEHEKATKDYITAIRKFPTYRRAYSNLGYTFMEMNKPEDALPMLLKAVELGLNESQVHGLIGFCYLNLEFYSSAEVSFRNALTFDPRKESWRIGLLNSLIGMGDYKEAIPIAEEILYLNPNTMTNWLNLASLRIRMNDYDAAISQFEVAHQLGSGSFVSHEQLSYLYFNKKLYVEAARSFETAIERATDDEQVAKGVEFCARLSKAGKHDLVEDLVAALRNRSEEVELKLDDWGLELVMLGIKVENFQLAGVEDRLKALLEQKPDSGMTALFLARLYSMTNREPMAFAYFSIAEQDKETRYDAFFEHGSLLIKQNRFREAIYKLENALALNPGGSLKSYIENLRSRL